MAQPVVGYVMPVDRDTAELLIRALSAYSVVCVRDRDLDELDLVIAEMEKIHRLVCPSCRNSVIHGEAVR